MFRSSQNDAIRARVDAFVSELSDLIHEAALEAVREALGGLASPSQGARKAKKKVAAAGGKAKAKAKTKTKTKGGRRVRRSAADLAGMEDAILAHVKANAGSSMTDLTAALGADAVVIRRPLNQLLEAGTMRKEGEKRGTRYFAGGAGPRGKKRKKAGRKAAKKTGRKKRATKRPA